LGVAAHALKLIGAKKWLIQNLTYAIFGKRLSVKLNPFDGNSLVDVAILHMHGSQKETFFLNNSIDEYSTNSVFAGGKKMAMVKKLVKLKNLISRISI
jgi:hypothetical protein